MKPNNDGVMESSFVKIYTRFLYSESSRFTFDLRQNQDQSIFYVPERDGNIKDKNRA